MKASKRYPLMLVAVFLLIYILPLGARDLFVPDETRYGEVPREMIASGDWVVPHLNGLRYFEKPVLGYWAQAGALLLLGENNFAVRLPSALAVGLSGLLIYLLLLGSLPGRGADDRWEAAMAVLVFFTCFLVFGVGTFALLDSLFSFLVTATIATFYFASQAPRGSGKERKFLLLAGLACGLAFLTKGFLALAIPVLALLPYLVWERRYKDIGRMAWLPLLTALLVALPWSIAIYWKEPDFWRFFVFNEHLRRFLADNAQHSRSFWFFFLAAPGLFLPWTFVSFAAVGGVRGRLANASPTRGLLRLSLCWLVFPFLFFSASSGKLLTYVLPCMPPFAILLVSGLTRVLAKGKSKAFKSGVAATLILSLLLLAALLYLKFIGVNGFNLFYEPWKWLVVFAITLSFVVFTFWSLKAKINKNKLLLLGMAPLLLHFSIHFLMPGFAFEQKAPGPLLERNQQAVRKDTIIISDNDMVRAACWYFRRNNIYLLKSSGELGYGLNFKDAKGRHLDLRSAADIIKRHPGHTVLVARARNIRQWRDRLPRPIFWDSSGREGYVLWRY